MVIQVITDAQIGERCLEGMDRDVHLGVGASATGE